MDSRESGNPIDIELALDRVNAQLANELPDHLRAFARAYAEGTPLPDAPNLAGRASTIAIGKRALGFPSLKARGVALLRIAAPILIERDASVVAAREAEATWDNYRVLCAARDAAARARFGLPARTAMHRLAGLGIGSDVARDPDPPPPLDGWNAEAAPLTDLAIEQAWTMLSSGAPSIGVLEIVRSERARPRMFAIERGVRAVIVIPSIVDTPAKRFAVLHELGHALLWLQLPTDGPTEWPRVVDEAMAAYVATTMETATLLPHGWYSDLAGRARMRRARLAALLASVEEDPARMPPSGAPPWALWHDPWAQSIYVHAEAIAAELQTMFHHPRGGNGVVEYLASMTHALDRDVVL